MAVTSRNMDQALQRIQEAPRWRASVPTDEVAAGNSAAIAAWNEGQVTSLLTPPRPKPLLIGLGHKAGHGKDTVAQHLVDEYSFHGFAFADAIRKIARAANPIVSRRGELVRYKQAQTWYGYDEAKEKYPEFRHILQSIGTAMRDQMPDFWIKVLHPRVHEELERGNDVVISDVRFPNEAEWVKRQGGHTVKVFRTGAPPVNHRSETALDGYHFDVLLDNSGTREQLLRRVDTLVRELRR